MKTIRAFLQGVASGADREALVRAFNSLFSSIVCGTCVPAVLAANPIIRTTAAIIVFFNGLPLKIAANTNATTPAYSIPAASKAMLYMVADNAGALSLVISEPFTTLSLPKYPSFDETRYVPIAVGLLENGTGGTVTQATNFDAASYTVTLSPIIGSAFPLQLSL